MAINTNSMYAKLLRVLSDGQPHDNIELSTEVGHTYGQLIYIARKSGYYIETERLHSNVYSYTLVATDEQLNDIKEHCYKKYNIHNKHVRIRVNQEQLQHIISGLYHASASEKVHIDTRYALSEILPKLNNLVSYDDEEE